MVPYVENSLCMKNSTVSFPHKRSFTSEIKAFSVENHVETVEIHTNDTCMNA